jgi:glycosyltransferase involved in cell wall biosynthesis
VTALPTPYQDFFFQTLADDSQVEFIVYFEKLLSRDHPWRTDLAKCYNAQFYRRAFGLDWHVLRVALKEKNSFFVIAGWVDLTTILLTNILCLTGRRFALWSDTPNLGRERNPVFALFRKQWLKWVFRRATKIFATGRPGAETFYRMGAPTAKLADFPFFVDLEAYRPEVRDSSFDPTRTIRFISSGRIQNNLKGHDIALQALASASRKSSLGFEYIIAGTGPDEPALRALARRLGVADRVHLAGWVEPVRLQDLYRSSHVLIHPSPVHDPFPNAVLEGMASGLVILGSDVSGSVQDRVRHGMNGFIHRAGDVTDLSEHIEFLLRNPLRIAEMALRARATAEEWPIERGISILKAVLNETH